MRIANYHPHTFVRQRTRLEAFVRSFGTPHETLTIDLLCDTPWTYMLLCLLLALDWYSRRRWGLT